MVLAAGVICGMSRLRVGAVGAVVLLLLGLIGDVEAQGGWIVDPGRGIGPLYVGMSYEEVLAAVGQPSGTSDIVGGQYLFGRSWRYNQLGLDVKFEIDVAGSPDFNRDFRLVTSLDVWGRALRTRGNVGVGSTLTEVVRVFGDSLQFSGQSPNLRQCVVSNVAIDSSTGEVSLWLNYIQTGIAFTFSPDGRVQKMTVKRTAECIAMGGR